MGTGCTPIAPLTLVQWQCTLVLSSSLVGVHGSFEEFISNGLYPNCSVYTISVLLFYHSSIMIGYGVESWLLPDFLDTVGPEVVINLLYEMVSWNLTNAPDTPQDLSELLRLFKLPLMSRWDTNLHQNFLFKFDCLLYFYLFVSCSCTECPNFLLRIF
jgi:hypothetical protein